MISFTDEGIDRYLKKMTTPETETLSEIREIAENRLGLANMICGPLVGQFLKTLITVGRCKRVLEIGSFVGYSAIAMADAMNDGELVTLELEKKYAEISAPYFSYSPYSSIIKQVMGPALDSLDHINGPFDLIFIDADKLSYKSYYLKTLPMLSRHGVMVIDNMLWSGEVLNPESEEAIALHELNRLIQEDDRVNNLLLPIRDGLHLVTHR
jgi:caffeoyl-CoA O-methyltransferase